MIGQYNLHSGSSMRDPVEWIDVWIQVLVRRSMAFGSLRWSVRYQARSGFAVEMYRCHYFETRSQWEMFEMNDFLVLLRCGNMLYGAW